MNLPPPPDNPTLRIILDVVRQGSEDDRSQRALHEALLWSTPLVPAKRAEGAGDDDYDIAFPRDDDTGEAVLAAFSDEDALMSWTGGEAVNCVAMSPELLFGTVLEHGFTALVLNPDSSGAVRLPREVVEGLARDCRARVGGAEPSS